MKSEGGRRIGGGYRGGKWRPLGVRELLAHSASQYRRQRAFVGEKPVEIAGPVTERSGMKKSWSGKIHSFTSSSTGTMLQ